MVSTPGVGSPTARRVASVVSHLTAQPSLLPRNHLPLRTPSAGALYSLRVLVKNFEFRRDENRAPLEQIVTETFPSLAMLLQALTLFVSQLLKKDIPSSDP